MASLIEPKLWEEAYSSHPISDSIASTTPPAPPALSMAKSPYMPNPFEAWLANLPALGYDRDWIRRNAQSLRARFDSGVPMPPCPPASVAPADRYEEL